MLKNFKLQFRSLHYLNGLDKNEFTFCYPVGCTNLRLSSLQRTRSVINLQYTEGELILRCLSGSSVGQVPEDWGFVDSTCLGILHVSLVTQRRPVKSGTNQPSPDYYSVDNAFPLLLYIFS